MFPIRNCIRIVNLSLFLLESQKRDYFTSLDEKHITENKCFWKTVKFCYFERITHSEEDDILIANEEEVAR